MVKKWLWSIALRKAVGKIVMIAVAFLTSTHISPILNEYGVAVDPSTLQTSLTTAIFGGLEMLRNFLKVKYGVNVL